MQYIQYTRGIRCYAYDEPACYWWMQSIQVYVRYYTVVEHTTSITIFFKIA